MARRNMPAFGHGTMVMGVTSSCLLRELVAPSKSVQRRRLSGAGGHPSSYLLRSAKQRERHHMSFGFENQFSGVIERAELCKSVEHHLCCFRGQ